MPIERQIYTSSRLKRDLELFKTPGKRNLRFVASGFPQVYISFCVPDRGPVVTASRKVLYLTDRVFVGDYLVQVGGISSTSRICENPPLS